MEAHNKSLLSIEVKYFGPQFAIIDWILILVVEWAHVSTFCEMVAANGVHVVHVSQSEWEPSARRKV